MIVSLTSFPSRFATLPLTLKCLLSQTMLPDEVVLWIAHEDRSKLTTDIMDLQSYGLVIRFCSDIKSFKKIIPSLSAYPDCYIVTADDDISYSLNWLERLILEYNGDRSEVLCHRAHKIRLNHAGLPLRYREWEWETHCQLRSPLIFPTSGAGALYPPNIFDGRVLDIDAFRTLCPKTDDVWLYWMVRLNGGRARKVGKQHRLVQWPGSQDIALWRANVVGSAGNDASIAAMIRYYGFPT